MNRLRKPSVIGPALVYVGMGGITLAAADRLKDMGAWYPSGVLFAVGCGWLAWGLWWALSQGSDGP